MSPRALPCRPPTLSSPGTKCKSVAVPASIKNFKNRTKQTEKGFPSSFANTLIQSPKSQQTPGHLLVGRVPCGQHGHRQERPPVPGPAPALIHHVSMESPEQRWNAGTSPGMQGHPVPWTAGPQRHSLARLWPGTAPASALPTQSKPSLLPPRKCWHSSSPVKCFW